MRVFLLALVAVSLQAQGSLVIVGGGMRDDRILERFIELAGGPYANIVIIPTASGGRSYGEDWDGLKPFQKAGLHNITVLHTKDRKVADSEEFVEPIRKARGVWLTGGRQWRLADSYLDTRTHEELRRLLARGGVIGGSSAGATIQGDYLVRGDTKTNEIVMGDHEQGFNFLPGTAIDQHLLARNRQFDLVEVIRAKPELLGIGIDENTAIVVRGSEFEVIGRSYVAIYDAQRSRRAEPFYLLSPGDRFDLGSRRKIQ